MTDVVKNKLNSIQDAYEKVRLKYKSDANWNYLLDYYNEINSAIGGGGGEILASDVITDDDSNVQEKIDLFASELVDVNLKIDNIENAIGLLEIEVSELDERVNELEQTPVMSISDTTSSVVISSSPNVTYLNMSVINWQQNSTTYFSISGTTLTILKGGIFYINVIVNVTKSGSGGGFSDGSLEGSIQINSIAGRNSSLIFPINADGSVGIGFSGNVPLSSGDELSINLIDNGTGTLTASTNADHDAFILQISKI